MRRLYRAAAISRRCRVDLARSDPRCALAAFRRPMSGGGGDGQTEVVPRGATLRKFPTPRGSPVDLLFGGSNVTVLEHKSRGGKTWLRVQAEGSTGGLMEGFLESSDVMDVSVAEPELEAAPMPNPAEAMRESLKAAGVVDESPQRQQAEKRQSAALLVGGDAVVLGSPSLRRTPQPRGASVDKLFDGTVVHVLGTKKRAGQTWFHVKAEGSGGGTVEGYLAETDIAADDGGGGYDEKEVSGAALAAGSSMAAAAATSSRRGGGGGLPPAVLAVLPKVVCGLGVLGGGAYLAWSWHQSGGEMPSLPKAPKMPDLPKVKVPKLPDRPKVLGGGGDEKDDAKKKQQQQDAASGFDEGTTGALVAALLAARHAQDELEREKDAIKAKLQSDETHARKLTEQPRKLTLDELGKLETELTTLLSVAGCRGTMRDAMERRLTVVAAELARRKGLDSAGVAAAENAALAASAKAKAEAAAAAAAAETQAAAAAKQAIEAEAEKAAAEKAAKAEAEKVAAERAAAERAAAEQAAAARSDAEKAAAKKAADEKAAAEQERLRRESAGR